MERFDSGFDQAGTFAAGIGGDGGGAAGALLTVVEDRSPDGPPEHAREVVIDVVSETLRDAMLFTAQTAGWRPRRSVRPDTVVVTDFLSTSVPADRRRTVLVVDPTPLGAREGMRALANGRVASLVCSDRTSDLRTALEALSEGWMATPSRVVELSAQMPELTERQLEMVAAVVSARTNVQIARELHVSLATVKRELAVIGGLLGASGRSELVQAARRLGVRPRTPVR